jgi:hypothetical protein
MTSIASCPNPETHGNPFRYCACGWSEPSPLPDEVRRRFEFHPATPTTGPLHDWIRAEHLKLAALIAEIVPTGRHQSLAFTALQESMMWANAGIACDTPKGEE